MSQYQQDHRQSWAARPVNKGWSPSGHSSDVTHRDIDTIINSSASFNVRLAQLRQIRQRIEAKSPADLGTDESSLLTYLDVSIAQLSMSRDYSEN